MMSDPNERRSGAPPESVVPLIDDDIDFADDESGSEAETPAPRNEIAMVLGPLLHRPGGLRDGAIYVLNLRSFRDHFGAGWPRYIMKVQEAADRVIAEELAPQDTYLRIGTDRYLLAFSRESEAAAAAKTAVIAKRITEKLFGERSALAIEVHALGTSAQVQAAASNAIAASHGVLPHGPLAGRELVDLSALVGANGMPDFVFVPIWDAYHKVLSSYACVPVQVLRSGRTRFGHELLPPGASEQERAEFDLKNFTYAAEVAADMHKNQFAVLVSFSISFESLISPRSRDLILSAIRKLPKHLGAVITVKINKAPDHIPTSALAERVALLRPYFRAVTLQLKTLDQDMGAYAYTGLHALVYGLFDWDQARPLDLDLAAQAVKQTKAAKLQFGFAGVTDLELANKLVAAGATYLSGPFLGTALDMPANMRRLTLDQLGKAKAGPP